MYMGGRKGGCSQGGENLLAPCLATQTHQTPWRRAQLPPTKKNQRLPTGQAPSLPKQSRMHGQTRLRLVVRLLGTLAQRAFGCVAKHAGKGRSWPPLCSAFVSCDLAFKALLLGEEKVSSSIPFPSRQIMVTILWTLHVGRGRFAGA